MHHFPAQVLLSLTAGSGEKWGGGRAFTWAVAAGRYNNSETGYRVLWERRYVVSVTPRKPSHTQESKEKLLRKVSYVTGACCRVSHNRADAFYQVQDAELEQQKCLPQPDCSPSPSIWSQDILSANSTFTEHISIRGIAGVQQQQKKGGSLVLITIRTERKKFRIFASKSHKHCELSDRAVKITE